MRFSLERTIEVLSATPATVRSMLEGLSDDWTSSGGQEDWGPYDVVGHLVHGEITDWIPRAQIILAQGENTEFVLFDRLAQFEHSKGKPLDILVGEFERLRRENLDRLSGWNLSEAELGLEGIHPEFGAVSLRELIATWAVHDLTHIRQIATSMAKRYDLAVGPWKEYLSILK